MNKILVFILAVSSVLSSSVNGQVSTYVGGGIGLGRYNGEIGYHDYLLMVPVSFSSRPSVSVIGGLQLGEYVQWEVNSHVQGYMGDNKNSTIPDFKKYLEARVSGTSVQLGTQIMIKFKRWPFIKIGGGASVLWNSYTTEGKWTTNTTVSMVQNTALVAVGSIGLKKFKYNDRLDLRYRLVYNLGDDFDGKLLGVMGDHLTEIQLVYTIPTRFVGMKMNGTPIRRSSRRGSSKCPTF
jgi:hypothetical protein